MNINRKNIEKIDDIYIHDSILKGYYYDYDKREIELYCEYKFSENKFYEIKFVFHNVIMSKLQSCYLWGAGLHVLTVYYEQDSILLQEAKKILEAKK